MIQIDLTHSELFKSFAEIESQDIYIDLHGEFKCDLISFQNQKRELILSFKVEAHFQKKVKQVDILFEDVTIESFSLKDDENTDSQTIDNIYRGRFEKEKDTLSEVLDDGRYYYYIDFYQNYSFELFAKSVIAKVFLND